jgi:hypothetical protein
MKAKRAYGNAGNALHGSIIAANGNLPGTSPGHPVTLCMALNSYQREASTGQAGGILTCGLDSGSPVSENR